MQSRRCVSTRTVTFRIFLEVGQEVHFTGGALYDAVNEGVRRGYTKGYLRKSVEADPIRRGNTGDNTPAMITVDIVPGDKVKITVAPKGFGSENMSALRMFKPSAGLQGIKDFILETVEKAGPNPCPPIVVGVGIGGNFDHVALAAKKALLRPIDSHNPDPRCQYRNPSDTHCRDALCSQYQLPRDKT